MITRFGWTARDEIHLGARLETRRRQAEDDDFAHRKRKRRSQPPSAVEFRLRLLSDYEITMQVCALFQKQGLHQ
jgi:hypothetical protein